MKYDARKAPGQPVNDSGNEARAKRRDTSDPYFAGSGVGEKFEIFDALAQFVEYGHSAIKQCAPVFGRLDTLTMAVEQAHAERLLQIRNRFRYVGLRRIQASRRLPHAAGLHNCHEGVQVLEL